MMVIGLAGIGITLSLGFLDFISQRRRPLRPFEQAAVVEMQRHRKGLGVPRLTEHWTFVVARDAGNSFRRAPCRGRVDGASHAGSK